METKDFREKTILELNEELIARFRELFNLRMQRASGELAKTHLFKSIRKDIARIKTIITEKQQESKND